MAKKKNVARFNLGDAVYLTIDRSEWQITHIIVDLNGQLNYRISNGYQWLEVYEQQLTENQSLTKPIKGFKDGKTN